MKPECKPLDRIVRKERRGFGVRLFSVFKDKDDDKVFRGLAQGSNSGSMS